MHVTHLWYKNNYKKKSDDDTSKKKYDFFTLHMWFYMQRCQTGVDVGSLTIYWIMILQNNVERIQT
jgi:hypothetical protein